MRQSTLQTLGLGSVSDIFRNGTAARRAPAIWSTEVFGGPGERGSLVISGANGIVGAGQDDAARSRLEPFGVSRSASTSRTCRRDRPAVPGPGRGRRPRAGRPDHGNIVRMTYDGTSLPADLGDVAPPFSAGSDSGDSRDQESPLQDIPRSVSRDRNPLGHVRFPEFGAGGGRGAPGLSS